MAPVPLAARVVEVIADLGAGEHPRFRYGSGFIVRAGTVLTAAHVVADAKSVSVRDPDKRTFPASADRRFTGDVHGPGPDLALLEIDDPEAGLPPVGLARVDRDSPTGEPVRDCQVIGYPAFMDQDTPDGGQVRETADATGHVPVLSRLAGGLLSVQVTHSPRPLPPREKALGESPWAGMSGAPVLAGGLLLGVVSEHAPREGPSAITAVPLTALEADPAHRGWGPGVTDPAAWWARLGVSGIGSLRWLPPRPDRTGIPLAAPFEVRRPRLLDQVIGALLADLPQPGPDGHLAGLVGMGGSGKSVLAAAAARDPRVRDAFPDGRFWLELGPDPPLLQLQAGLAAALGDSTPVTDIPQGRARLSRLLAERRCLLVLDNVQAAADLAAFPVAGPAGRVLVTTRDAAAIPGGTRIVLDELAPEAALQLLAGWTATPVRLLPVEAALAAEECGYLPLALALCGALVNAGSHNWRQLLGLLREADLDALPIRLEDYPHRSLAVALGASLATLPQEARGRYMRLAVFSNEGPVPQAALQLLWGLGEQDTAALAGDLAAESLLRAEAGRVSLHDLQMDYLVQAAGDGLPALHDRLLAAYRGRCPGGWATGPDDGYFRQHLARHLHHAGRITELRALLLDLDWMSAKLAAGDLSGLLADYDTLPSDPAAHLVAAVLRLSAHVLARNPGQLPGQLSGRLAGQQDPQLQDLLQRARRWAATSWLRPLTASLTLPGGPLLRILNGHGGRVHAVAVTADGRRAVSGSEDGTVRVWDLEAGTAVHALTGHHAEVHAVAVSADGRRAVSGSYDGTVRVWDLEAGTAVHTLTGHGWLVSAVAVTADGRRAVSGGQDKTLRVWDLEAGTEVYALTGHDWVDAVTVTPDGRRAVSGGGEDGMVRVWDLEAGAAAHALTGHDGRVTTVAVSGDGRRAVSGGRDGTVRVWDLEAGTAVHALPGHDWVWAVTVTPDGRRAVSGGWDGTVRVWDLEAGTAVHALTGHGGRVRAVAVTPDGRRAVSGGEDGTVRVWDLEAGAAAHATGHGWLVSAVAVSADGRRAVSGSEDGTVRVWDLEAGAAAHTLTGHDSRVHAVAVTPDGRRAVSGSEDATVRVWDLEAGTAVHALTGHRGRVHAVAVTADGRRAVSRRGQDGTVQVWNLATGKQIAPASWRLQHLLTRFRSFFTLYEAYPLSISADGRRAVSGGGDDGMVRVWDLEAGTAVHALTGHDGEVHAVAVSADGRRAVSGSEYRTVQVWDLEAGTEVYALTGHDSRVSAVAVTPDGRRAVSGGDDGMVRVWDVAHGVELASFASDSSITVLAVTPPGIRVIAGTSAGPVHLLELCAYEQPPGA
jgi:WD40 repeat protein